MTQLIGPTVRQMREQAGFSQKELAFALGVTNEHLCRVENGKVRPTPSLLKLIAKHLQGSLFELLTAAGYLKVNVPTEYYSSVKALWDLGALDIEWLDGSGTKARFGHRSFIGQATIDRIANQLMSDYVSRFGFDGYPPIPVGDIAHRLLGLSVWRLPSDSATYLGRLDRQQNVIEVNISRCKTEDLVRYTIAHEIGHFVLHARNITLGGTFHEADADKCAVALLIPAEMLKQALHDYRVIDPVDRLRLALAFDVALNVMERRLVQLNYLPWDRVNRDLTSYPISLRLSRYKGSSLYYTDLWRHTNGMPLLQGK
jgi:transcriptional regulator with XRE-family HTH domain